MDLLSENITPDLLVAYLNGELTPEENTLVEQWIAASEENQREFDSLRKIWDATADALPPPADVDIQTAWDKVSARIDQWDIKTNNKVVHSFPSYRRIFLRVAAVMLPLAILGYYYWSFFYDSQMRQLDSGNTIVNQILPDGTNAKLNKNTILGYPEKFKGRQRLVSLSGEAWFKVEKNPGIPFLVKTDDVIIKVVGTEFDVNAPRTADTVSVYVYSGKVVLYTGNKDKPGDSLLLGPGNTGYYIRSDHSLFLKSGEDKNDLFWVTRTLVFKKTPLKDVFAAVEEAYTVSIHVNHPGIEDLQLTTSFSSLPVEQVMKIIAESFNLSIRQENNIFEVYATYE
ncbi:MAG: FecR domain-containing protein [Bacteroidales bacterium]